MSTLMYELSDPVTVVLKLLHLKGLVQKIGMRQYLNTEIIVFKVAFAPDLKLWYH